jgi:hypothetical protein
MRHHHEIGQCGVYTYEVAETKVTQVMDFANETVHTLTSRNSPAMEVNMSGIATVLNKRKIET